VIKTVIRCANNMVMVFDEKGEQIPEYQGQYGEVKEGILKNAPPATVFGCSSDSKPELVEIPREEW
jgi:hypothetical protein